MAKVLGGKSLGWATTRLRGNNRREPSTVTLITSSANLEKGIVIALLVGLHCGQDARMDAQASGTACAW